MSSKEDGLRILIITDDRFPPFRVDLTELFDQEFSSRGHQISWLMQSEESCSKSYYTTWSNGEAWVGSTNNGYSALDRVSKNIRGFVNDLKLFSILRKKKYDCIQVKDKFVAALIAILAAKFNSLPFVYWLSYPFPEADLYAFKQGTKRYSYIYWIRGNLFKFLLYRVILQKAEHIFVQSEQMKKDVSQYGIPLKKLTAVPMGVSMELLQHYNMNNISKKNYKEKWVVYIGILIRERRLDFLVRTFKRVVQKVENTKLYFVGDGVVPDDLKLLKDEVMRCGLGNLVVFTGFLPREQALSYVKDADVCVSPFYPTPILNSTSPTKLIEYLALGKAAVVNDHPEQRHVIEESGGGICVPYDEDAFANAIITLLTDQCKAEEMGKKGHAYVLRERIYGKIAEIVEKQYQLICR